ncbi:BlaI/MecI/CopY family transcriptional regulator [Secundilactobacillus oryzae]|nr:BlaI/MecI/CopY family transcriptional regulator [Secundilactobacillus oryzae]
MTETLNISDAEWEVMRIVWTLGEAKSHDIIDNLTQKKGLESVHNKNVN